MPTLRIQHNDRVVVLGDSITLLGWWAGLETAVAAALSGTVFLNSGVGGWGIANFQGADQVLQYVTAKTPNVLIVMLGVNDIALTNTQFRDFYNLFLDRVFAANPILRVGLSGPWLNGSLIPDGSNPNDTYMNDFRDIVLDIAGQRSLTYVNFRLDALNNWDPGLTTDGIHASASGNARLSAVMLASCVLDASQGFRSGSHMQGGRRVG